MRKQLFWDLDQTEEHTVVKAKLWAQVSWPVSDAKKVQLQGVTFCPRSERRHAYLMPYPGPCQCQLNTISKLKATSQIPKAWDLLAAAGRMVCRKKVKGRRQKQGGCPCLGGQSQTPDLTERTGR